VIVHGARPRTDPEIIQRRIAELALAFKETEDAMHRFDGTGSGDPFGVPEMREAHRFLETAWLWARSAIERN
jgi:hypothetical protein